MIRIRKNLNESEHVDPQTDFINPNHITLLLGDWICCESCGSETTMTCSICGWPLCENCSCPDCPDID